MTALLKKRRAMTPEKFILNEHKLKGYELVDGFLKRKAMGAVSGHLNATCTIAVGVHIIQNRLGWIFGSDTMYQCCPSKPSQIRKPDFSFIRYGRFSNEELPQGIITIAPDFMIEVLSPNESWMETETKIEEFLEAGTPVIWVVNSATKTVSIFRRGQSVQRLYEGTEIDASPELGAWKVPVSALLPATAKS